MSTIKRYENRQPGYTDRYVIEYRWESGGFYTMWCREKPSGSYPPDGEKAHVDTKSGLICIHPGKEPRSLEYAEAFAHYWMQGYSTYIRTGEFPDRGGRVNVAS